MKRSIFYSWQSDLESFGNRNLIEDALKRAIKSIGRDEAFALAPVLDRDTAGLSGSPSISDSIFAKIALADIFVSDISIINNGSGERLTPNPNVLIELGYAVSQLGWDRVLLIQNTAYGSPEQLPFDLRERRVICYSFEHNAGNRSEVRTSLQGKLELAIKSMLSESTQTFLPTGLDAQLWWGKWSIENNGLAYGGEMFIRDVNATGFLFDISVFSGSHIGTLTAQARLVSPNLAYARVTNGKSGEFGEIIFRRELSQGRRVIHVEETANCSYYRGIGVIFAGDFAHIKDSLFDSGVLNELQLARLYSITGEYYDSFRQRFQLIRSAENIDTFPASVVVGGVRGLYTIMEGILMRGENGALWVAYIDNDIVRYFTSQSKWKYVLPKTINDWRIRFQEKKVIAHPYVDIVPGHVDSITPTNSNIDEYYRLNRT